MPSTGIVNYRQVAQHIAQEFQKLGGEIRLHSQVMQISEQTDSVTITLNHDSQIETLHTHFMISCAGLMADRITRLMGLATNFQIIPFRGEYYRLPAKYNQIVKHLIYPIPDPALPF